MMRRECLDWLIVLNERHLRSVMRPRWVAHYNQGRPHGSLGGIPDLPRDRLRSPTGSGSLMATKSLPPRSWRADITNIAWNRLRRELSEPCAVRSFAKATANAFAVDPGSGSSRMTFARRNSVHLSAWLASGTIGSARVWDPTTITLESMTTSGHNVTMREVRIAELKARLSQYLRAVRGGETIAVFDRETPVAQIVPVRDRTALRIRKPAPGTPPPNRVPLPKRLKSTIDVVQLLLEERQLHR
jgi:prevent-host-death family protein